MESVEGDRFTQFVQTIFAGSVQIPGQQMSQSQPRPTQRAAQVTDDFRWGEFPIRYPYTLVRQEIDYYTESQFQTAHYSLR